MELFNEVFDRWVTKKNVLILSGSLSFVLFLWTGLGNFKLCDLLSISSSGDCPRTLGYRESYLLIFVGVFVFSLFLFLLKDEVFKAWVRFAVFWVVLTTFFILETQTDYGSFIGWTKNTTAIFCSFLFCVISLIVILVRITQVYWRKK